MNNRNTQNGNLVNLNNIDANFNDYQDEPYIPIAAQEARLNNDQNIQPLEDDTSEILETSGNTFYGFNGISMKKHRIYNRYLISLLLSDFLLNDLQQFSQRLQNSPLMDAIFSIESVPLVWTIELSSHPQPLLPPGNNRRFFMAQMHHSEFNPSLDVSQQLSSHFSSLENFFQEKFAQNKLSPFKYQKIFTNDVRTIRLE